MRERAPGPRTGVMRLKRVASRSGPSACALLFRFTSVSAPTASHRTSSYSATTSSATGAAGRVEAAPRLVGASTSIGAGGPPALAGALPLAAERGGIFREREGVCVCVCVVWLSARTAPPPHLCRTGSAGTRGAGRGRGKGRSEKRASERAFCFHSSLFPDAGPRERRGLGPARPRTHAHSRHVQHLLPGAADQGQGENQREGVKRGRRGLLLSSRSHFPTCASKPALFPFTRPRAPLSFLGPPPHHPRHPGRRALAQRSPLSSPKLRAISARGCIRRLALPPRPARRRDSDRRHGRAFHLRRPLQR